MFILYCNSDMLKQMKKIHIKFISSSDEDSKTQILAGMLTFRLTSSTYLKKKETICNISLHDTNI